MERRFADLDEAARPELVTRDELYDRLQARLADPPRRLSALERDAIAQSAAREAATHVPALTFKLRPGLVGEMLRFYDELRRHRQQVSRFEELIIDALGGADEDGADRGAQRLRLQTRFLAEAFREYERRVRESGACDEHLLRERLIADASPNPARRIVVTVPDWIADASGLFDSDFDLLARIPGLEVLDIVATEALLASGFHQRLHDWWPGLEEEHSGLGIRDSGFEGFEGFGKPLLVAPPNPESQIPNPDTNHYWTVRDREEELVTIARVVKADRRAGDGVPLDRIAVVFKRPLPYLYLAAETFPSAGLAYRTFDALPLAVEPVAAAFDLVLETVSANFTRAALVALLRSPHFVLQHDDIEISRDSISALDRMLSDRRYLGDVERLERLEVRNVERPAFEAALACARELAQLRVSATASAHIQRLLAFWNAHARPIDDNDPTAARTRRGRAAIEQTLSALAAVHAAHHDPEWTIEDVALAVRRVLSDQTFEPEGAAAGIHVVDDQAARYGEFDRIALVGLIEPEWPEKPRRNIFYPPSLLKALGWPSEKDRRAADDARFLELIASSRARTMLFTFTLDEDALVSPSAQLDDVPRARLSTVPHESFENARVFVDEALSIEPVALHALAGEARSWADVRVSRTAADAARFHGAVGTRAARAWSVSALETYLSCPFKFFAQHVLKLEEEPDDEEVMDPKRQGRFVHEVFERFFRAWQDEGHRAITPANIGAARELFAKIVETALESLPEAEAGLERTRLLGSPAAAGLGEAVFRMEAERAIDVVERLLEEKLEGGFTIATAEGDRRVSLRGKADRIDLLADGTFRLIDYKLGWPPNKARALQLPIYSVCAEQKLSARGRAWVVGEAAYLAFKGTKRVVPLFSSAADRAKVLAEAQQRLADTVDAIDRGEFPPTPDDVYRCETCTYASVCRKDYVGDV